jgi:nucleoside 2-deoxyribosyltransferase
MRIYFAASLFTQLERNWNRRLKDRIEQILPEAKIFLPQDIKINGAYEDPKNNGKLFNQCVKGIDNADIVLAVMEGCDVDSGTSWEMGYAYAKGKKVIGIRTDFRPGPDHGVNVMLGRSCNYVVREFAFLEDVDAVAEAVVRRLLKMKRSERAGKAKKAAQ